MFNTQPLTFNDSWASKINLLAQATANLQSAQSFTLLDLFIPFVTSSFLRSNICSNVKPVTSKFLLPKKNACSCSITFRCVVGPFSPGTIVSPTKLIELQ